MKTAAVLNHEYRVAAYAVVWAVQLGYVLLLTLKWRAQKRAAERAGLAGR